MPSPYASLSPAGLHNSYIIYFRIINKEQHPLYVMYSIFSWRSDCQDLFSRRYGEENISQPSDKRYFTHHTDLKLFVFEYSEKNSQNPPMSGSFFFPPSCIMKFLPGTTSSVTWLAFFATQSKINIPPTPPRPTQSVLVPRPDSLSSLEADVVQHVR